MALEARVHPCKLVSSCQAWKTLLQLIIKYLVTIKKNYQHYCLAHAHISMVFTTPNTLFEYKAKRFCKRFLLSTLVKPSRRHKGKKQGCIDPVSTGDCYNLLQWALSTQARVKPIPALKKKCFITTTRDDYFRPGHPTVRTVLEDTKRDSQSAKCITLWRPFT